MHEIPPLMLRSLRYHLWSMMKAFVTKLVCRNPPRPSFYGAIVSDDTVDLEIVRRWVFL